jgi:hypothetical protein
VVENTKSDQRITYYFGTRGSSKPTMEEVDSFITEEMGLVRDDGGAKWTEGVTELIMLGMDSWRQGQVERAHLVSPERVESLEERNRELREKVSDLQAKVDKLDRDDGKIEAAVQVQRIEASILKVLCNNIGAKSPNYMSIEEVSDKTGHDYDTVVHYAVMLSRVEFGGYVQFDRMEDNIKVQREDAYEKYCESAGIDGVTLDG